MLPKENRKQSSKREFKEMLQSSPNSNKKQMKELEERQGDLHVLNAKLSFN